MHRTLVTGGRGAAGLTSKAGRDGTMTNRENSQRPAGTMRRSAVFGATLGVALLGSSVSVLAAQITVWSGYPEMAPFYQHVADGLKAQFPDLTVDVEAIGLR